MSKRTLDEFFDDDDDDEPAAPPPAPPAPAAVPAPTTFARATSHESESSLPAIPNLPKVSLLDRLDPSRASSRSTQPPTPVAPAPAPSPKADASEAPVVNTKPWDERPAQEAGSSSGAGSSLSLADILAGYNAKMAPSAIEEASRGKGKAHASRSKSAPAPSAKGKAPAAKPPQKKVTAQDLEDEAMALGSGDEEEDPVQDEVEDEVEEAIEEDEEEYDRVEWPPFDGDGYAPKEPHALGERPKAVPGSIYPPEAYIPASINKHLRPYQREGVAWMWKQYEGGKGGILGDEMGLGKTVQTIAFITAVLGKTATSEDRERRYPLPEGDRRQALVVVPTSTIANWQREFKTWGCFRLVLGHGARKKDAIAQALEGGCDVLLTTPATLLNNTEEIGEIKWTAAIFDEVHELKNPKGKKNKAAHEVLDRSGCTGRFGLSGTPMSNKYEELWALFDLVSGKRVGERKDFTAHYTKALGAGFKRKASQHELMMRIKRQVQLKTLLDSWMLQRFKTLIKDEMPKKEDNVVFCKLASEQQEVYERVIESNEYELIRSANDPCSCGSGMPTKDCHNHDPDGILFKWAKAHRGGVSCSKCPNCIGLPAITQLLKVGNHLEMLKPDPERMKKGSDEYQKQTEFARMAFGLEHGQSAVMDRDRKFLNTSNETACGKMRAVVSLLKIFKAKKQKVLLFSYSTQMLDILESMIVRKGYIYLRLDGKTPATMRGKMVDDFNNVPEKFVFLLSTKAGGLGLNLVSATAVIVFDPNWNPSYDMQAQDRAYRIGQRHDVKVYRLIASNTVEEKIYQRQLYKQGQEGLVLHQRDENRYFDGVMGDTNNRGELFGYKNLFTYDPEAAGVAGGSTTRNLLSRKRSNLDGEEEAEADYYIEKDLTRESKPEPTGEDDEEEGAGEADADDEYGLGALMPELGGGGGGEGGSSSGGQQAGSSRDVDFDAMLRESGMVHSHINDKVLGGRALPEHLANAPDDEEGDGGKGDDAMDGSGAPRPPTFKQEKLQPEGGVKSEGVKQERGVKHETEAKTEPAAKRAMAERVVLHGSDQEVRQLLRACDCYDEFLHDLKTDPTYAAAVLKCVTSANKDKLVNAVNALPQDS